MRILTACLPTLMVAGLAVALATQTPAKALVGDPAARDAERQRLEQQRLEITNKLEGLKLPGHHWLPRGGL